MVRLTVTPVTISMTFPLPLLLRAKLWRTESMKRLREMVLKGQMGRLKIMRRKKRKPNSNPTTWTTDIWSNRLDQLRSHRSPLSGRPGTGTWFSTCRPPSSLGQALPSPGTSGWRRASPRRRPGPSPPPCSAHQRRGAPRYQLTTLSGNTP